MEINANGLALIKHFEGLFLKAYVDPVGVVTIGYGHTRTARPGMEITEAEAEALLKSDLAGHEAFVGNAVKVDLNRNQFSALVSFAFNVGNGALGGSTLLKKLNEGKFSAAARQFDEWVKGTINGVKVTLPGLVRRRGSERKLFEEGVLDFGNGPVHLLADDTPAPPPPAAPVAASAADSAEARFTQLFNSWGIRHFRAFELLVLGASNSNPESPAYRVNTLPPENLWRNIRPTVTVLDKLREKIGSPIQTLSVYRNPAYNAKIGGATASLHMKFNAIDFQVKNTTLSPAQWAGLLQDMKSNGDFDGFIGTYPSFVHVDTRGDLG